MRAIRIFLYVLSLLPLAACTTTRTTQTKYQSDVKRRVLPVPFVAQKKNHCGPATLNMAAKYIDHNINDKFIEKMTMIPNKGTLPFDMISTTRRMGLQAKAVNSIEGIIASANHGYPTIALLNVGFLWMTQWHYVIVVGYDLTDNVLILHSDQEPFLQMSFRDFLSKWEDFDRWAIQISSLPKTNASGS